MTSALQRRTGAGSAPGIHSELLQAGKALGRMVSAQSFTKILPFGSFVIVTSAARSLSREEFAGLFLLNAVSQTLLAFDGGIGSTLVSLVTRGEDVASAFSQVGGARRRLLRLSNVALVLLGGCGAFAFRDGGLRGVEVAAIAIQLIAMAIAVRLLPYERVLYAEQKIRPLATSALGGAGCSALLGLTALRGSATARLPLLAGALVGPTLVMSIRAWWVCRALRFPWYPSSTTEASLLVRRFATLQVCGVVAFGLDQLVVGMLLPAADAATYAAHARPYAIGTVASAAVWASVWPPIARLIRDSETRAARHAYHLAMFAVLFVAGGLAMVQSSGLLPVQWFLKGAHQEPLLAASLAAWFVVAQLGNVLGQVQAALNDLKFQTRVGIVMAILNLPTSLILALRIGPAGPPIGSLITYFPVVFVPVFLRLRNDRVWDSARPPQPHSHTYEIPICEGSR